jgi:hypothetical protein
VAGSAGVLRGSLRRILIPLVEAVSAPHGPDRYLEMIDPTWSLREARAKIIEVRRYPGTQVMLRLRPNGNWRSSAGR